MTARRGTVPGDTRQESDTARALTVLAPGRALLALTRRRPQIHLHWLSDARYEQMPDDKIP